MKNEQLKWFSYNQNNPGGRFIVDADVAQTVCIQAHSADEANQIAESKGIYFDGVADGTDCSCCGDRWRRQDDDCDGTDVPCLYGEPVENWDICVEQNNGFSVGGCNDRMRFHRFGV